VTGTLYVVSTPIGNLADLTERARTVLAEADLIACEDTRRTGALLHHLGIKRRLVSLHEHNERQRTPALLAELEGGASVALVSDAGTPLLSDPGYLLVREAIARDLPVVPVPGASAPITALVVSGFPPYPFTFAGFPPPKSGRRRRFFEQLARLGHTVVVFESPHRIARCLDDAIAAFGADHPAALGRELTKLHEEILRGSLSELRARLEERGTVKGELVLVLGPGEDERRRRTDAHPQPDVPTS
jgi:16S rRNA (cytidine1402-2'-O)-methyltransferase